MKRIRRLWIRPIFTKHRQKGEYHNNYTPGDEALRSKVSFPLFKNVSGEICFIAGDGMSSYICTMISMMLHLSLC